MSATSTVASLGLPIRISATPAAIASGTVARNRPAARPLPNPNLLPSPTPSPNLHFSLAPPSTGLCSVILAASSTSAPTGTTNMSATSTVVSPGPLAKISATPIATASGSEIISWLGWRKRGPYSSGMDVFGTGKTDLCRNVPEALFFIFSEDWFLFDGWSEYLGWCLTN